MPAAATLFHTGSRAAISRRRAALAVRRLRRGAVELLAVILLTVLAGVALAAWQAAEGRAVTRSRLAADGAVFAAWTFAAHRAAQTNDYSTAIAAGGTLLTPAAIRTAGAGPPGLRDTLVFATMTFGVIDDGNGVAMAFAVLDPARDEHLPGLVTGMVSTGITVAEYAAGPAGLLATHRPAIEALVGTAIPTDAVYVTADALPVRAATLYRRSQPGRPWLTAMDADLDIATHALLDASTIATGTMTSTAAVQAGTLDVEGAASAASLSAVDLDAALVDAGAAFTLTGNLLVGTLTAIGALTPGSANVTGDLQAASLQATTLAAQDVTVAGSASITAGIAADRAAAGTLAGTPTVTTATVTASGGVYGPSLTVTGALTVGSCDGC